MLRKDLDAGSQKQMTYNITNDLAHVLRLLLITFSDIKVIIHQFVDTFLEN